MRRKLQRGAVLILVLWVVVLLTVLLAAFGSLVRVEKSLAEGTVQRVRARAAAEAVLHYLAAYNLAAPADAAPTAAGPQPPVVGDATGLAAMAGIVYELPVPGLQARFRLLPEAAFLSLNGASREQLQQLLTSLDPQLDADRLSALIVDWRDPDDEPSENGAEADDYRSLGLDYGPANAPFRSVEELALLPGFPGWLVDVIAPLVTVDSAHPGFDPRFAPPPLLYAFFGDAAEALARVQGSPDASAEAERLLASGADDGAGMAAAGAGGAGGVYRVQVEVTGGRRAQQLEVTASFGAGQPPFRALRWNEYTARFSLPAAP